MKNFILFFILSTFALTTIYITSTPGSSQVDILFSLEAILISFSLFYLRKTPFSLFQIFHLFFFIFFCIAPIAQFHHGTIMWKRTNIFTLSDYTIAILYIILIIVIFNISYIISYKIIKIKQSTEHKFSKLSTKHEFILISVSLISFFIVLAWNDFNYFSVLFRGGVFATKINIESTSLVLIIRFFIRPIGIFLFLLAKQRGVKHNISLFVLGFIAIITAPPTGMPRFAAACLYLPIVLTFFPFFQRKNRIVILLLFGLLFIFPLLNNFRHFSGNQNISIFANFDTMFLSGDFDAFQNFMYVVKYNIITFGHQLAGVLLFWVPRSIWPSKPIGSGFYIADLLNLQFNNISMPFFGEAYINFGFLGLIIFASTIGYTLAYVDKYYTNNYKKNNLFNIFYFVLFGLLFYMQRGDLINSFSYLCSFSLLYFIFSRLINKFTITREFAS
ncbi:O-antigen polysaccharide polymerase Wzy [Prolixibacter sp. NT017]|uniref:O-antigen polysaccharide polymerase Wzy n=1 Tax=Prolixibacter sp. NT017 TaxID=2652390 RepID=UPI0012994DA0|nr:O-antigen polysaccharide polymerase Wzy [Prolixibacter sp. NT017]